MINEPIADLGQVDASNSCKVSLLFLAWVWVMQVILYACMLVSELASIFMLVHLTKPPLHNLRRLLWQITSLP